MSFIVRARHLFSSEHYFSVQQTSSAPCAVSQVLLGAKDTRGASDLVHRLGACFPGGHTI